MTQQCYCACMLVHYCKGYELQQRLSVGKMWICKDIDKTSFPW
jgi:hypothetical protein